MPVSTLLSTKPFVEFGFFVKYILKKIKQSNDKLNKRLLFSLLDHIPPQAETYPSKSELSISELYTLNKMYLKPKVVKHGFNKQSTVLELQLKNSDRLSVENVRPKIENREKHLGNIGNARRNRENIM